MCKNWIEIMINVLFLMIIFYEIYRNKFKNLNKYDFLIYFFIIINIDIFWGWGLGIGDWGLGIVKKINKLD